MSLMILDIDGTLVDTNYQHAIAWYRSFRRQGIAIPIWQIHRHIGIGRNQLVQALTDDETEQKYGEAIREGERRFYREMIGEVQAVKGSRELIEDLKSRAHTVLLASSAKPEEVEHYIDLLDARELVDGWTSCADGTAIEPTPDLVNTAMMRSGAEARDTLMIGDSPWDLEAARTANVQTLAVMTGGFSQDELLHAGAAVVFESVSELRGELDETAAIKINRRRVLAARSGRQ